MKSQRKRRSPEQRAFGSSKPSAIIGVAQNDYSRVQQVDDLAQIFVALQRALDDAGLSKDDIDGLIVNMSPPDGLVDMLPIMLGLNNINFSMQLWAHGRMNATACMVAATAVKAGLARRILCVSALTIGGFRTVYAGTNVGTNPENTREGGGTHLESPHYGLLTPPGGAALATRKYMHRYGYKEEDLFCLTASARQWAKKNPNSVQRTDVDHTSYMSSRYVVEPMRLMDMAILANTATCVIVADGDCAADTRHPISISGMQGGYAGREAFIFGRGNLGIGYQPESSYEAPKSLLALDMAGLTRKDVRVLSILNDVSTCVPFVLEDLGFCEEGEALRWLNSGVADRDGPFINTHGGDLSEGMSAGWGGIVEAVRQVRGEAEERQVKNVEATMYCSLDRSALVLMRSN